MSVSKNSRKKKIMDFDFAQQLSPRSTKIIQSIDRMGSPGVNPAAAVEAAAAPPPDPSKEIERLTKKIAKCDKLLQKKGKNHADYKKLEGKRSTYIRQLGEWVYRQATAGAATANNASGTDAAPLSHEASPKCVMMENNVNEELSVQDLVEARPSPTTPRSSTAGFQDSLAVFEMSMALPLVDDDQEEDDDNNNNNNNRNETNTADSQTKQERTSTDVKEEVGDNRETPDADDKKEVPVVEKEMDGEDETEDIAPADGDQPLEGNNDENPFLHRPPETVPTMKLVLDSSSARNSKEIRHKFDTCSPNQKRKSKRGGSACGSDESCSLSSSSHHSNKSPKHHMNKLPSPGATLLSYLEDKPAEESPSKGPTSLSTYLDEHRPPSPPFDGTNQAVVADLENDSTASQQLEKEQKEDQKSVTEETSDRNEKMAAPMVPVAHPCDEERKETEKEQDEKKEDESTLESSAVEEATIPVEETSNVNVLVDQKSSADEFDSSNVIVLVSTYPDSMYEIMPKQKRILTILMAHKIKPTMVDGADPEQRTKRNELFAISGLRGVYPQFFIVDAKTKQPKFFADNDTIEELNDAGILKQELEKACLA